MSHCHKLMMALLELAETKSVAGSNLSKKVTDGGDVGTCPLGGGHLKGKGCSHVCVLKRRFLFTNADYFDSIP